MRKTDIIKQIARNHKLTQAQAAAIVDEILDSIMDEVAKGNDVIFTGFGSFKRVAHRPKQVRNPRTGNMMDVPEQYFARFKFGKKFKALMNKND